MKCSEQEEQAAWRALINAIKEADASMASQPLLRKRREYADISQREEVIREGTGTKDIREHDQARDSMESPSEDRCHGDSHTISFETYDRHRREWEERCKKLEMGLMMYRYKFEEMEHRMKLLPVPAELMTKEMEMQVARVRALEDEKHQKEGIIASAQEIAREARSACQRYEASLAELQARLKEEEQAKAAFRVEWEKAMSESERPWWKRILGIR
jgi:hypothetical protein